MRMLTYEVMNTKGEGRTTLGHNLDRHRGQVKRGEVGWSTAQKVAGQRTDLLRVAGETIGGSRFSRPPGVFISGQCVRKNHIALV